jgi:hypothetical protein
LPKHVWSIRVRLEMSENKRDLALFNSAIDSKLRGCDLVCLRVSDVFSAGRVMKRASMLESKTVSRADRATEGRARVPFRVPEQANVSDVSALNRLIRRLKGARWLLRASAWRWIVSTFVLSFAKSGTRLRRGRAE